MTRKSATYLVKAGISVAFFWMLFSYIRGNELAAMLGRIDWFYFVLSFLLMPLMLSVSCLKWKMLLDVREPRIPFLTLIRIYLIGYFFSNLLPSNVGGDVVRSYYTGRLISSQAYSAVCVFVERFSGVLLLILLVIFAPLLRPHLYAIPYVSVPAAAALALLLIIGWVWTVREPLRLPEKMMNGFFATLNKGAERAGIQILRRVVHACEGLGRTLFKKLARFHQELISAVAVIRRDGLLLAKLGAATVFFYFLTWINVYVSFLAFGVRPDFLAVCALVPVIMFAAHLPVTLLGNLGYFESVFVLYFFLIGIPPAETLAMGLLLRLKMMSLGAVGYLVYLLYKYHRAQELRQLEEFARQRRVEFSRATVGTDTGGEDMAKDDIGSIQSQLARPGSALAKYRLASVGEGGYLRLALYEFLQLTAGSLPGAAGFSLRRLCYPLLFRRVGRSVLFGLDCSFRRPHRIELGDGVFLGARVALDVKDEAAAIILGRKVAVGEGTIFSCPGGRMVIGDDTVIGRFSRLGSLMGLTVGRGCAIGDFTYIVGAGHASDSLERPIIEQPTTCRGPSRIGDQAVIGERVTVLDGVTIGSGARVASGSLVVRDVPPGAMAEGVPARLG